MANVSARAARESPDQTSDASTSDASLLKPKDIMPWTVACFCGDLFDGPATSCPHCAVEVPDEVVRPSPRRVREAQTASAANLEPGPKVTRARRGSLTLDMSGRLERSNL
jgi:hypothetical protein